MSPGHAAPDVLEANLERLFARAYEPVQASAEFRARLRLALEGRIAAPVAARAGIRWRVAAAILVLLGGALLGWTLLRRSATPPAVDPLVADGGGAPRGTAPAPGGAVTGVESDPGAERGAAPGEQKLEPFAAPPERASAATVAAQDPTQAAVIPPTVADLHGTLVLPEGQSMPESFDVTLLRKERLPQVSQPVSRTFPGASKEFAFEDLRPGKWSVFVQVSGYAACVTRDVELAPGKPIDLACELHPGVALRGRVLDAGGKAVEGALVLAEEETPVQVLALTLADAPPSWTAAARSDAEGVFELPHLGPGRKTLRATLAGHGAGWTEPIDPADSTGGVEIRLTRAGAIEGRVAHDNGAPWAGAQVIVSFLDMSFQRPCMSYGHGVAGVDGHYAIEDLPPGAYVAFNAVEPRASGGPVSPRILMAHVEPGARVQVDLPGTLRGAVVEGLLVSAKGEPMKELDVTLVPDGHGHQDWKSARSGDDGGFRFPDVAPGPYDVFVGKDLGTQYVRQARIEVPAAPVFRPTITVASGSLRGRVTAAATGAGLPMCVVILGTELEGKGGRTFEFVGKTMSDAQGHYEFLWLPPGSYRASAYATSGLYGQETRSDVDVRDDAADRTLDFALHPGAALSVRVVDAAGRAVRGATIRFTTESGSDVQFNQEDETDANGFLRAQGLKPGRWTVQATREPEGRARTVIEVTAGEERTLDLELAPDH